MTSTTHADRSTPEDTLFAAERARRLVSALRSANALALDDLLDMLDEETRGDELNGRRWRIAVRHMCDGNHLSGSQVEALVIRIAASVTAPRITVRAPLATRHMVWREQLRAFDEASLALRFADQGQALLDSLDKELKELRKKPWRSDDERIRYEAPRPAAPRIFDTPRRVRDDPEDDLGDVDDYDYLQDLYNVESPPSEQDLGLDESEVEEMALAAEDIEIASNVEWWRQAVDPEVEVDVDTVLGFAVLECTRNPEGAGDNWIASIQQARDTGIVDPELAAMLLDRVALAMVGAADSDPVLSDLADGMRRLGFDARWEGADSWTGDPQVVREWRIQRAAYLEREEELKREILVARGERELVREMEESPDEFRERVEGVRREWGVEG